MRTCDLSKLTGKMVREWYEWLVTNDCGCCCIHFASTDNYRYCVCMGWHDLGDGPAEKNYRHWEVAWKIGRQTHNNIMQCDFDIDFEMPYVTEAMAEADPELVEGDVDDTLETVERRGASGRRPGGPEGYRDWNALAAQMRKTARRVWEDWKEEA